MSGVVYIEPGIYKNEAGVSVVMQCASCMYNDISAPARGGGECIRRCSIHHCDVDGDQCCKNWTPKEALVTAGVRKIGDEPAIKASRFELLKGLVDMMWKDIDGMKKFIDEHKDIPKYKMLVDKRQLEIKELKKQIAETESEMRQIPPHARRLSTDKKEGKCKSLQEFVDGIDDLLAFAASEVADLKFRKRGGRLKKRKIANINKPISLPKDRRSCQSVRATIVCTKHIVIERV